MKKIFLIAGGIASIVTVIGLFWSNDGDDNNYTEGDSSIETNVDTEQNTSNTSGDEGINISGDNNTVTINRDEETSNKESHLPTEGNSNSFNENSSNTKKRILANSVAILPFNIISKNNNDSWLSKGIPEGLINELVQVNGLTFLERNLIDKLLAEIDFEQSKYVSDEKSVELGKLLGVETIVLGACQIVNNETLLTSRVVNVQSGVINKCCAVQQNGNMDDIFQSEKLLAKQIKECIKGCI